MIVAEQKPLSELKTLIDSAENVLVVGCGTCVTVCFAGGSREAAITALASLNNEQSATTLLHAYSQLSTTEKASAITTLTRHKDSARALLQGIADGQVPRSHLSVVAARQILQFDDAELTKALETHWGSFKATNQDKASALSRWKSALSPEHLHDANLGNGRRVFNETCFVCHQLFGQGIALGPDITGANRTDLDYLLENILDPNSLVPLDYQLVVFTMKDASILSGMIRKESDTAYTLALPGGTESIVTKADVVTKETLPQSLMPEGILDALDSDDARDLIAYLQTNKQVRLSQDGEIIIEGEALHVVSKTGNVAPQSMQSFTADHWSEDTHLWWTGGRSGDTLVLAFDIPKEGRYELAAVLTKAVDYGKVRIALDDETRFILDEVNLYDPQVVTTGELPLGAHELAAGTHQLYLNILGKDPNAAPGYMVGIDYLQLVPVSGEK